MRLRTFGWSATKLAEHHTLADLNALRIGLESDPANADPVHKRGGLYLYNPLTRRKLDALAWAVTYKLAESRMAAS